MLVTEALSSRVRARLVSAVLGEGIDGMINRTIYTPNQGTGVTVSPLLGPDRLGLTARIRFGPDH
jgi:hypothetical protein